ncbi:MAG: response regulator [Bacteroidales bacterium]|nr:response regulator [Bacteroidales bacterium]
MDELIQILHLEDDPADSLLVKAYLKKAGINFDYELAVNEDEFQSFLRGNSVDIVLSDFHLPDYNGYEALRFVRKNFPHLPFIFISGNMGEEAAIESLLNGATDYVLKNNLDRLGPSVKRAHRDSIISREKDKIEKENKKLFRAIEQSPNSIIITDFDGNIEYINPEGLKITGYEQYELIGKNPRIFSSGETPPEVYKNLWDTLKSGKAWSGEFHNKKKNGELYWEQASISPVIDSNGNITHFLATKVDVSERKNLIDDLIKAKEKAEENDRLKTAFLHNISHEIRTPMNAIVGFSGFLNDPDLNAEKRSQYVDVIVQSSNQLLSIITDIINISTIEAGQSKLFESEVKLNAIMRLLHDQFNLKARDRNIKIELHLALPDNESEIRIDEVKLNSVISYLLGNAIKFTNEGIISFGYDLNGDELRFYVKDTGIGIPKNMHEEIFKRFRQVESSVAREYGGSGLGLSIAKSYVNLMGGKIWLESEPGMGSAFYFSIPWKPLDTMSVESSENQKTSELNNMEIDDKKTLLIAEDEDSNYMLLEELLSDFRVILIRANNGQEAVDICKQNKRIDLILMDIKMPLMDGYEATRLIHDMNPEIPIIAQTAYSTEKEKKKALEFGCDDFISKPIKNKVFLEKIRNQLFKS